MGFRLPPTPSAVISLGLFRGPSNVAGHVPTGVIDPVNRHGRFWLASYVRQKCLETGHPFFAHSYSASAVVLIVLCIFIEAARLDVGPSSILGTARAFLAAMPMLVSWQVVVLIAAAASCSASRQLGRSNAMHSATSASAYPFAFSSTPHRIDLDRRKQSEAATGDFMFSHYRIIPWVPLK